MSTITTNSGMANMHSRESGVTETELEEKFERLQNNLEPQVTELQEKVGRLVQNNLEPQVEVLQNKVRQLECRVASIANSTRKKKDKKKTKKPLKWWPWIVTRCITGVIVVISVIVAVILVALGIPAMGYTENKLNVKEFNSTPDYIIDEVKTPQGIAFHHKHDIIIVAEYTEHRVAVFNRFSRKKIRTFGSKGSEAGEFNHPSAVVVDDDGSILVADQKNHRIQIFRCENGMLKFVTDVSRESTPPLKIDFPVGIAIHPHTKMIYVTENKKTDRIQILYPNMTLFRGLYGEFNQPKGVAFDSIGNIYVADNENHQIQVFTEDGHFLRRFGKHGEGKGELKYPSGISIDSNDLLYVTELYNYRISVFELDGTFVASFGIKGNKEGQFIDPRGIAVDKNGTIYVSDHGNDRIQVFLR